MIKMDENKDPVETSNDVDAAFEVLDYLFDFVESEFIERRAKQLRLLAEQISGNGQQIQDLIDINCKEIPRTIEVIEANHDCSRWFQDIKKEKMFTSALEFMDDCNSGNNEKDDNRNDE
jgi:hypothetical protein